MKKILTLTAASLAAISITYGQYVTVYETDFTTGFSEGAELSADSNWNASGGFTTEDVAGDGFAQALGTFKKANYTGTTFNLLVGESIKITTEMRITGVYDGAGNSELMTLGLSSTNNGTVDLGALVKLNNSQNITVTDTIANVSGGEGETNTSITPIGIYDGPSLTTSDLFTYVVEITKSATADQFTVTATVTDLEGTLQNSGGDSWTITNAAFYADTDVFATANTKQIKQAMTGAELNSFKVEYNAVPEPGTYALIAGALALGSVMIRRRRS